MEITMAQQDEKMIANTLKYLKTIPQMKDVLKNFNVIHITGKGNKKINSYDNYNAFEMRNDITSGLP